MKKAICVLLSAATLVLCACGGTTAAETTPTVKPEQTATPTQAVTPEPTVTPKPDKSGFNEATNTEYTLGGIVFQIPSYYGEPKSSNAGEKILVYESYVSVGGIIFDDNDTSVSEENFRENQKDLIDMLAKKYSAEIGEIEEITICGVPAARTEVSDAKYSGCMIIFPNTRGESLSVIIAIYSSDADYDYMSDFERILSSAVPAEETDSDGVTPAFKAQMDSYEEFFNEYVEFMQSYMNSDDMAGMLIKYASMMSKYADMMDALDSIDESELSTADYAYYIEVTARITQNMAKILG